jgi:hypothetical protein
MYIDIYLLMSSNTDNTNFCILLKNVDGPKQADVVVAAVRVDGMRLSLN